MQSAGPKIKPIVSIAVSLMIAFCCRSAWSDNAPQVKTDKDIYNAGETISVNFSGAPGYDSDWICIAAAGSRDDEAGDYKYLPNKTSQGVLTFAAPQPGKYEVRAYYNYNRNGYVVSVRYSFSVADKVISAKPVSREEKMYPVEGPAIRSSSAGGQLFNVAVFYFTPLNVEATNYSIIVTNTLTNAPKMQSAFSVLGRKDLEIFLSSSNLQQNDQIDNIIDIGGKLGLNFVIAGNIGKRGTTIVTNCKVVSIEHRSIIFTNQFLSRGEADLVSNAMKMSNSIIETILRSNN